ncbi:MAG: FtsQ-type POTRA domain-containing protein [Candidatus Saganbacteria bacterium]|nr:FtsQ-type POTRA domain-containing protein [Candidatus Saganbacteria bacterium]
MARKTNKKKPFKLPNNFWRFLFVAVFLFLFLGLPIWNLNNVAVSGAKLLIPEDLISIANLPYGQNIFLVSFSGSTRDLGKLPQLKKVGLHRRLPATVLIQVEEREPYAVAVIGDQSFVIDKDGVLLNSPRALVDVILPEISTLPVVTGLKKEVVENSFYIKQEYTSAIQQTFGSLFKIMNTRKLKLTMAELDDISLLVEDVLQVRLGKAEDLEKKIEYLRVLLAKAGGDFSKIEYIDLRYLNNPAVKFRG